MMCLVYHVKLNGSRMWFVLRESHGVWWSEDRHHAQTMTQQCAVDLVRKLRASMGYVGRILWTAV